MYLVECIAEDLFQLSCPPSNLRLLGSTVFFSFLLRISLPYPFRLLQVFSVAIQCLSLPSALLEQGDNYRVSKLRGDTHQHL